jgi:tRNA U34 5-methylaminomethyl-2-thiouridine-forming methyltransferase MnmC
MISLQLTGDGSYTFYSNQFSQAFHSISGAKQEAQKKFVEPCLLTEKAVSSSSLKILDVCYGLGYNSAAAIEAIWLANSHCHIDIIALELEDIVPKSAISYQLLDIWSQPIPVLLSQLANQYTITVDYLAGRLILGDARITLPENIQVDAIFLDPFSPTKCPQLWTVEFLGKLAQCLKKDGLLATYSCAASVRSALMEVGLAIGQAPNVGRRSPGTIASYSNHNLVPLSLQEQEHLKTKAAIPYRDPFLRDSSEEIETRRALEQKQSDLEPSSHWKKRWQRS